MLNRRIFCASRLPVRRKLSNRFWGEACIPKSYLGKTFSDIFRLEDFIDAMPFNPG
jgi:hypothetical protein